MMLPLDGPSSQYTLSVNTTVVTEVKNGAERWAGRSVITLQPTDGRIYVFFGDGGPAPSAATVIARGFLIFKNAKETYEASDKQEVYILAVSGTVSVRVAERA